MIQTIFKILDLVTTVDNVVPLATYTVHLTYFKLKIKYILLLFKRR